MEVKQIGNTGVYKQFYNNVGSDVALYEVDINDHRCIFHIDGANKILYPLHLVKHPENNKNRR